MDRDGKNKSGNQQVDDLINWLRDYAATRINSRLIDERRCVPPHIVLDFGNKGLFGMQVPQKYGGLGLNYVETFRVYKQLAAVDLSLAILPAIHSILGTRPILKYAQESLKQEFLPLLASGRGLGAFAFTEPAAGSNPRAIISTATTFGNGWVLNGQKTWIGSGSWASVVTIFAQQYDVNNSPIGISAFAVRSDAKGFKPGREALTMGVRGLVQNEIELDNLQVEQNNLLGELGAGMVVGQDIMLMGRLGLGAISVGGMKRCLQLMLRYAQRRRIGTGLLLDNPVTLTRMSDLSSATSALEALVDTVAELLDRGSAVPEEVYSVCKIMGGELLGKAADQLMQLLGGRGYIETNIVPQIYRDARIIRIFEGPTETLQMFLGSSVSNQEQSLYSFIEHTLGVPRVTIRLKEAVEQITEQLGQKRQTFTDKNISMRWIHSQIGEVVSWAVLWAATQRMYNILQKKDHQMSLNWAEVQFEQRLSSILEGFPGELVVRSPEELNSCIMDYSIGIGDVEQMLAGETQLLDDTLSVWKEADNHQRYDIQPEKQTFHSESVDQASDEFSREAETYVAENLENWIQKWLVNQLKISADALKPESAFADFGVDSVTSVLLVADLEKQLDCHLDETLLWNYPTIDTLVDHLVNSNKVKAEQMSEQLSTPELSGV